MKGLIIGLVLAALGGMPFAASAAQAPGPGQAPPPAFGADEKPGAIRGHVTAADTGRPLRRAKITLIPAAQIPGAIAPPPAFTNGAGRFEARGVPPGAYFVSAARTGYLTLQHGQRRPREKGVAVEVRAGQTVERIDIALPRGAVLGGVVVDELGEPYPGVRVDALRIWYDRGRRRLLPAGVATSDDLGWFRIPGLEPGNYYLGASSSDTWRNKKKEMLGYDSSYFPGGPIELAQPISLAASEIRLGLQIALQASRTVQISGRVIRETGEPVPGRGVTLAYSYPGVMMTAGMRSARTEADGRFQFKGIAGGTYLVIAAGAGERVRVADQDINDVLLVVRTGSTILGTLVTDEGTEPPFGPSGVSVLLDTSSDDVLPTVRVVSVDTDWSFKLTSVGGPFLFRLRGLPKGWMLGSVRFGENEITDSPWDVPTGGKELSGLTMVVTRKVGSLAGTVTDADGKPTSAAVVVIFSDDPDLWIPGSRFTQTTRPVSDGTFSITNLPGGGYYAIARDYIEEGLWEVPGFLEEARAEAVPFTLSEGGSATVTLKLPKK